jgi:hypothetical protein
MSQPLLSDRLWAVIELLIPPEPGKPKGGRPRVGDRAALMGILFNHGCNFQGPGGGFRILSGRPGGSRPRANEQNVRNSC